jgi:hypothetical protein
MFAGGQFPIRPAFVSRSIGQHPGRVLPKKFDPLGSSPGGFLFRQIFRARLWEGAWSRPLKGARKQARIADGVLSRSGGCQVKARASERISDGAYRTLVEQSPQRIPQFVGGETRFVQV